MAEPLQDFVVENANNPGTGTINLAGAATGPFVSFATRFSTGDKPFYGITDETSQREIGIGTFTIGSPNTLTRDTVLSNTSGTTSKLNFTGLVFVYNPLPASHAVYADENGDVTLGAADLNVLGDAHVAGDIDVINVNSTGTIAATGVVTGSNDAATWHDVTGSRVLTTTYTNSKTYPISVMVTTGTGGGGGGSLLAVTVGGVVISAGQSSAVAGNYNTNFQVPAGATYAVGGGGTMSKWFELF